MPVRQSVLSWPAATLMITLAVGLTFPFSASEAQQAQEVLSLGELEGREDVAFTRINSVVIGPDGRILVLEASDLTIRVFDPQGRFLHRIGRLGSGPGEFRALSGAAFIGDTLVVFDWNLRRLTYFRPNGEVARTRLTTFSLGQHGSPVRMTALPNGGLVLETQLGCVPPRREGMDALWRLMYIPPDSPDPVEWMVAVQTRQFPVYTADGRTCTNLFLPFAPGATGAVATDGRVATGMGDAPSVALHDGMTARGGPLGTPQRTLTLVEPMRPFTRADREWWQREFVDARLNPREPGPLDGELRTLRGSLTMPSHWAAYDRLAFAFDGDLWVRQPPGSAATARWDVIRRDGTHRGTVRLPANLEIHAITRSGVFGVSAGEWDELYVKQFAVRWN